MYTKKCQIYYYFFCFLLVPGIVHICMFMYINTPKNMYINARYTLTKLWIKPLMHKPCNLQTLKVLNIFFCIPVLFIFAAIFKYGIFIGADFFFSLSHVIVHELLCKRHLPNKNLSNRTFYKYTTLLYKQTARTNKHMHGWHVVLYM